MNNAKLIEAAKVIMAFDTDTDPETSDIGGTGFTVLLRTKNGKKLLIRISFYSTTDMFGGEVWAEVSIGKVEISDTNEEVHIMNYYDHINVVNEKQLKGIPTKNILELLLPTVEKDGYFQTALLFLLGQRGEKKNIYWETPTSTRRLDWDHDTLDDHSLIEIHKKYQRRQAQMEVLERDLPPYLDPLRSAIMDYV